VEHSVGSRSRRASKLPARFAEPSKDRGPPPRTIDKCTEDELADEFDVAGALQEAHDKGLILELRDDQAIDLSFFDSQEAETIPGCCIAKTNSLAVRHATHCTLRCPHYSYP
jgi:hypothetical protein